MADQVTKPVHLYLYLQTPNMLQNQCTCTYTCKLQTGYKTGAPVLISAISKHVTKLVQLYLYLQTSNRLQNQCTCTYICKLQTGYKTVAPVIISTNSKEVTKPVHLNLYLQTQNEGLLERGLLCPFRADTFRKGISVQENKNRE